MIGTSRQKALVLAFSFALMAGCSSTGTKTGAAGQGSEVQSMDQSGGGQSYGTEGNGGVSSSNMNEQQGTEQAQQSQAQQEAALRKIRTFYFDFDTSEIKPEARNVLMAHAHYLASHPSMHVQLQGYTDERGTQEYNLALGQRRANAVKQFLVVNGVSPDQISTISYGEEKPAAKGHNEAAWAKNRRVVMIYQ